jgi:protein-disulfide isomerase
MRAPAPPSSRGRSPLLWLTGGGLIAGLALVAVLVVLNQPRSGLTLIPPGDPKPASIVDGRSLGSATAPVTLEAYEDFQCPACGLYSRATEPRLIAEYVIGGRLRIVFRDFAFIGQESRVAAAAARAAGLQGAFWPYHDWLFANQNGENRGGYRREVLVEIARRLDLDVARFERDLDDPSTATAVRDETRAGEAVPIDSTPTLVVNGTIIEGLEWGPIAAAVDAALGLGPSPSAAP